MSRVKKEFSHYEIIEWLHSELPTDNIHKNYLSFEDIIDESVVEDKTLKSKIKKGKLDVDINYSVDFIHVETKQEKSDIKKDLTINVNYYTLFLIASSFSSSQDIISLFNDRIRFYQFYFSTIAKIRTLRIVLIVPYYAVITSKIKSDLNKNGIGLWKITAHKKKIEILSPKSLRERINAEFEKGLSDKNLLKTTIKDISATINVRHKTLVDALANKSDDSKHPV